MTYNQTVASLLAILLASVHCQPLAASLAAPRKSEESSLEDQGDLSSDLNEIDGASGELKYSADTSDTFAGDEDVLEKLKDILDSSDAPEISEDAEEAPEISQDSEVVSERSDDTQDAPEMSEDTQGSRRPSQDDEDDLAEDSDLQEDPEGRSHAVGIFLRQLLPLIASAFFSSVTTVIFNWFYPFKVVPPPPGLVGVSQLWGGLPHPHHWHHHWGHLHQGPGKWGNGNWGHAYWGPAYSGHTPPAPPAHPWEPHPHAHLKRAVPK